MESNVLLLVKKECCLFKVDASHDPLLGQGRYEIPHEDASRCAFWPDLSLSVRSVC